MELVSTGVAIGFCIVFCKAIGRFWQEKCPRCHRRGCIRLKHWDSGYGYHEQWRCQRCGHEYETFVRQLRV